MERYTKPPVYDMPQTAEVIALATFTAIAVLLLTYAIWLGKRHRTPLPILIFLGAGCTFLAEPIIDVMMNVVHSQEGQMQVLAVEGHPIPLYVIPAYCCAFSLFPLALFDRIYNQTIPKRFWWKLTALEFVIAGLLDQLPVHYDLWHYYGDQPLKLGYMPISMIAANAACILLPVLVIYRLMPILTGWCQLAVVGIVPSVGIAGAAGAGLLAWCALGTDTQATSQVVLQGAGLLTLAMSAFTLWVMLEFVYLRDGSPKAL